MSSRQQQALTSEAYWRLAARLSGAAILEERARTLVETANRITDNALAEAGIPQADPSKGLTLSETGFVAEFTPKE